MPDDITEDLDRLAAHLTPEQRKRLEAIALDPTLHVIETAEIIDGAEIRCLQPSTTGEMCPCCAERVRLRKEELAENEALDAEQFAWMRTHGYDV